MKVDVGTDGWSEGTMDVFAMTSHADSNLKLLFTILLQLIVVLCAQAEFSFTSLVNISSHRLATHWSAQ
jgi:hypothetical protein